MDQEAQRGQRVLTAPMVLMGLTGRMEREARLEPQDQQESEAQRDQRESEAQREPQEMTGQTERTELTE